MNLNHKRKVQGENLIFMHDQVERNHDREVDILSGIFDAKGLSVEAVVRIIYPPDSQCFL